MASRYYGLNRGQHLKDIVEGSSTGTKDIEAVLDLSASMEKREFLEALELFKQRLIKENWPPAATTTGWYRRFGMNRGQKLVDVVSSNPVAASATITAATVLEADTVTVNGAVLTAQDLREKFTVQTVADSSGSLNSTWFKFYLPDSNTGYYVWFSINAVGVDPAPTGLTGIKVSGATNASANTLAAAINAALESALPGIVTSSVSTDTVTVIMVSTGAASDVVDGSAATGFTLTVTRQGAGAPGTGKFTIHGGNTLVAADIARAINVSTQAANVAGTSSAAVCTATAVASGTGGNSLTLVSSNGTRLAVTGAGTLASGAAASTSYKAYLTVLTDKGFTKHEATLAIDEIVSYVTADAWPPA